MSHDKGTRPDLAEGTAAPRGGAVPPWRLNLVLAAAMAAVNLVQLAALPLWLLPLDMRWGLVLADTCDDWNVLGDLCRFKKTQASPRLPQGG